jgi:RNA polymerase sigma-70 factor (ECF subfamily)
VLRMKAERIALATAGPEPPVGVHPPAAAEPRASADFAAIFQELAPYVLRVLPRMGVAASDVDDVAQEVFLAVHRGLPGFEGRSSVRTWVYGICVRTCSNYRQRAHRRHERLEAAPQPDGDARDPERALSTGRALAKLDAALAQLPEAQRAVFVLFEIEQLAISEIAVALDCSKFTLYARLYAARRAVRAALGASAQEVADGA